MITEVSIPKDVDTSSGSLVLSPANFPWLKTLAASFERYRWHKLNIHWRAAGGYTKGGLIAVGVDWSSSYALNLSAVTRAQVLALTPHMSLPISSAGGGKVLGLPTRLLNSRNWYDLSSTTDEGALGALKYNVKCDTDTNARFVGEVWVDYEIVLQGTKA